MATSEPSHPIPAEWNASLDEEIERRIDGYTDILLGFRDLGDAAIGAAIAACAAIVVPVPFPQRWGVVAIATAIAAIGAMRLRRNDYRFTDVHKAVSALAEASGVAEALTVVMVLTAGSICVGQDIGQVVFCEGWMNFVGLRCSWSVRARDIASLEEHLNQRAPTGVQFRAGGQNTSVWLCPVGIAWQSHAELARQIGRFVGADESPTGEPVLPPAHPSKRQIARSRRALELSSRIAVVSTLLLLAELPWALANAAPRDQVPTVIFVVTGIGCALGQWLYRIYVHQSLLKASRRSDA